MIARRFSYTIPAMDWQSTFENELATAVAARKSGNEGRARVCARRAAGVVIGEYLRRNALPAPATALDRLRLLASDPGFSSEIRKLTGRFLVRLTPDYQLPIEADLLADARRLAEILLEDLA